MKKKRILSGAAVALLLVAAVAFAAFGQSPAHAATMDDAICETYKPSGTQRLTGAPAIILEANDKTALNTIGVGGERPTCVILNFGADGKAADADGKGLCDFETLYKTVLKGKIIPVLRVNTESAADAMIDFYLNKTSIIDSAVLSSDPAILKKVRKALPKIRGVYEADENTDVKKLPGIANAAYANTVILTADRASTDTVAYIQARFKTVWVRTASPDAFSVIDATASGAYGVITTDYAAAYAAFAAYPKESLARTSFNVAHRGLPTSKNENSVSGLLAAAKAGATHVELDGYLTTDKKIYMLHDGSLDRTTTGTGYIENLSSSTIDGFRLKQYYDEKIPSIDDIFAAMKRNKIILILEIKSNKYVDFIDVLKAKLDEYDLYDRVTVISFTEEAIARMSEVLTEIPTSLLMNKASHDNFAEVLGKMTAYNTTVDGNVSGANALYNRMLRDRGYAGWFWTYDSPSAVKAAQAGGYTGLTNNYAASMSDTTRFVRGKIGQTATDPKPGDEIEVETTAFSGKTATVSGTIFKCEDRGEYYDVIAYANTGGKNLFTRAFRVEKEGGAPEPPQDPELPEKPDAPEAPDNGGSVESAKNGCGGARGESVAALATFAFVLGIAFLKIRKF